MTTSSRSRSATTCSTSRRGAAPGRRRRSSELRISPPPSVMTERIDFFGNTATFATIEEPHRQLSVTAINVTELAPTPPPQAELDAPLGVGARPAAHATASPDVLAASQFVFDSPYVPAASAFAAYAAPSFPPGRPILEAVLDLTARIHAEFRYDPTATTIATPIKEVLEQRHGVCQDFAHLQIGCLRSLGLAARYVSGYLVNDPPPGQPAPGRRRRLARLGLVLLPRLRLDRLRPDQQPGPLRPAHRPRLGPRLRRRQPHQGRHPRRRQPHGQGEVDIVPISSGENPTSAEPHEESAFSREFPTQGSYKHLGAEDDRI